MDEDADRKPEPQSDIIERRQLRSRLNREFREMQEESDDGWGVANDPLNNPANYVDVPLWEAIDSNAYKIRQFDYSEKDDVPYSTHLAHVYR